jgi:exonuclease III
MSNEQPTQGRPVLGERREANNMNEGKDNKGPNKTKNIQATRYPTRKIIANPYLAIKKRKGTKRSDKKRKQKEKENVEHNGPQLDDAELSSDGDEDTRTPTMAEPERDRNPRDNRQAINNPYKKAAKVESYDSDIPELERAEDSGSDDDDEQEPTTNVQPPNLQRYQQETIQFPKEKKRKKPLRQHTGPTPDDDEDHKRKENMHWADSMDTKIQNDWIRVYFQNINGLRAANRFQDAMELFHSAAASHIAILGLAETNVPWHDKAVTGKVRSRMRQCWEASKMATSSATEATGDTEYQPGGTALFVHGDWTGRVIDSTEDSHNMGRWSTVRLQGSEGKKLAIICGYRVVNTDMQRAGPSTAYFQQWAKLRAEGNEQPDPRKQFLTDLSAYIKGLRKDNHAILLMMDANESTRAHNSQITKFLEECDMVDLHENQHRNLHGKPNTYIRGKECIDMIAGTVDVAEEVERAGIEAFYQTFYSDHRGLFIDMNMNKLLKGSPAELGVLPKRGVNATDPSKIIPFQKAVAKYFAEHHMMTRRQTLDRLLDLMYEPDEEQMATIKALMEGLDKDLT